MQMERGRGAWYAKEGLPAGGLVKNEWAERDFRAQDSGELFKHTRVGAC